MHPLAAAWYTQTTQGEKCSESDDEEDEDDDDVRLWLKTAHTARFLPGPARLQLICMFACTTNTPLSSSPPPQWKPRVRASAAAGPGALGARHPTGAPTSSALKRHPHPPTTKPPTHGEKRHCVEQTGPQGWQEGGGGFVRMKGGTVAAQLFALPAQHKETAQQT